MGVARRAVGRDRLDRAGGWTQVIDFTFPGLHDFVAADLYLHNTAFGLGIATHVAMTTTKPVLVFSLEMAHQELTQRILSSEARVDSTKIRTGRLAEADWAKIGKAIGRLEVPLFLDDNPVTVMEIRQGAPHQSRYEGIGLILIDYLRLMSGNSSAENRQLGDSDISRNLEDPGPRARVPDHRPQPAQPPARTRPTTAHALRPCRRSGLAGAGRGRRDVPVSRRGVPPR